MSCFLCVALCGNVGECLFAGVIFWPQDPGATRNWEHALLTSGVRTVTTFHREIGTVSIRELLADRAHWLLSLEKLPIKLTHVLISGVYCGLQQTCNLPITASTISCTLQQRTSFSHLVLEKNTWLSSLNLNNLEINKFCLLLHDIYIPGKCNNWALYIQSQERMMTMSSVIQKLLNKMLSGNCVLYAKFEV